MLVGMYYTVYITDKFLFSTVQCFMLLSKYLKSLVAGTSTEKDPGKMDLNTKPI